MSPRRVLLSLAVLGVVAGSAAPAFASPDTTRVCINATHDRENPGSAPFCVWLPLDR